MLPAKTDAWSVSEQSATDQPGDSLHAYDRFSKIKRRWSKGYRGDDKRGARRSSRLGSTNSCGALRRLVV